MSARDNHRLRILLVGTLTNRVSGTSVNLRPLVEWLSRRDDIHFTFLNTEQTTPGAAGALLRVAQVLALCLWHGLRHDVITFHMNEPQKGIPVWLVARLCRKPFLLRWFGGVEYRSHGSKLRRACARFMLRHADVNLFQTHHLVEQSIEDGSKLSLWFSNSRVAPADEQIGSSIPERLRSFMFAGHVKPEKGIHVLIDAAERLDEGLSVSVYGPFFPGCSDSDFEGRNRIGYRGVLAPGDVIKTMRGHDALVLPTFFPGEGYPGVVIESYFAGRPVITTQWLSIPEIVNDTCGILIPPHDPDALHAAMQQLAADPDRYRQLCEGARAMADTFRAERWAAYFLEVCKLLHRRDTAALRALDPLA